METKSFFHNSIIFRRGEVLGKEKKPNKKKPTKIRTRC